MNNRPPYCIECSKGALYLEGNYEVRFGREPAGKVQVLRQGLYYRFVCRCRLTGDIVCRLQVTCGSQKENLGIVVPMGDGFGLETRLPAKRLGQGDWVFSLVPKHEIVTGNFYPITPEDPFAYIARLKDAYLIRKEGQMGVTITPGTD